MTLDEPLVERSIELYMGGSAEFVLSNFSGLLTPQEGFGLSLLLVSLNMSNMSLSASLGLDWDGDGDEDGVVWFESYTSEMALVPEKVYLGVNRSTGQLGNFTSGTMLLRLNRTDGLDGWLRVVCGGGDNSSYLRTPYSRPLMADAGPDIETKVNRTVVLDASGSSSVAPQETEYVWEVEAPDGSVETLSGALVNATLRQPGLHNATLRLRWRGFEDRDAAIINASPNQPPLAHAIVIGLPKAKEPQHFFAIATDPDGSVVSWHWDFGDGISAEGMNANHSYAAPGEYTVVLTVRDDDGAEARVERIVHINHPPKISSVSVSLTGRNATFKAHATDPENDMLEYFWNFGDGTIGSGVETSHRYDTPQLFRVSCIAKDPLEDFDTYYLNVSIVNSHPRALDGIRAPSSVYVEEAIRFEADVMDPDGDTLSFTWSFGDGTASRERAPYHIYKSPSRYKVTLLVSDGYSELTLHTFIEVKEKGMEIDPGVISSVLCFALFLVTIIIAILRAARRRAAQGPGQPPQPYSAPPPVPPLQYTPAPPPPPRPRAPITACTRCGSTNLIGFPDGHVKCFDCRKIMFNG